MGGKVEETKPSKEKKVNKDATDTKELQSVAESVPLPVPVNDGASTPKESADKFQQTTKAQAEEPAPRPATASGGWFGGWLGGTQTPEPDAQSFPEPTKAVEVPQELPKESLKEPPKEPVTEEMSSQTEVNTQPDSTAAASSSWFGLWSSGPPVEKSEAQNSVEVGKGEDTAMEVGTYQKTVPQPIPVAQPAPANKTWVFWSSETTKKLATDPGGSEEVGKISISGESSENQPKPFTIEEPSQSTKGTSIKRSRPKSVEINESIKELAMASSGTSTPVSSTKVQPPNLFIPSLKATYRMAESPTFLQQLARFLSLSQQSPPKHLYLVKQPPRIKHAIAIGLVDSLLYML
jgi:hypothetical protein